MIHDSFALFLWGANTEGGQIKERNNANSRCLRSSWAYPYILMPTVISTLSMYVYLYMFDQNEQKIDAHSDIYINIAFYAGQTALRMNP